MFSMMLDMIRVSSDRKHLQVFDKGRLDYIMSFVISLDQVTQITVTKRVRRKFLLCNWIITYMRKASLR